MCTGNICRSPAGHAVLQKKLNEAAAQGETWASKVVVDSCGLGGWHEGEAPDRRAQKAGKKRGYDLNHPARAITGADLITSDLILAMDQGHSNKLKRLLPQTVDPKCVRLFRSFDQYSRPDDEVADPYYGGEDGFEQMFDVIEAAMPGIMSWLKMRVAR